MINFTEQELEEIINDSNEHWMLVDETNTQVIFTGRDRQTAFYAFSYNDEEISEVYSVFPREVTTIVWEKIYD